MALTGLSAPDTTITLMLPFLHRSVCCYLVLAILSCCMPLSLSGQQDGSWYYESPRGVTPKPRNDASLVWVGNYAYLLGGTGPTPVQRYDPKQKEWASMQTVLDNLHHFQAQVYDGKIYIIGAFQGHYLYEVPYDKVLRYDPANDRLETLGSLPRGRERGAAGLVRFNDHLYLIGGHRNGHAARTRGGGSEAPVAWVDRYDPSTGNWETLPDAPRARDHFQAIVHGDRIIAVGGGRAKQGVAAGLYGELAQEIDVLDPNSEKWLSATDADALPDLPQGVTGAVAGILDGKLVVAGGMTADGKQATGLTQVLDLKAKRWSVDKQMIRSRFLAAGAVHKDRLYVAGGSGKEGDRLTGGDVYIEFYSQQQESIPTFDGWVELTPSDYPRAEGHMIAYGDEFYHFNGFDFDLQLQDKNEKYNPATDTWTALAPHPRGRNGEEIAATHVGVALVDDVVWVVGGRIGSHPGRVTSEVFLYDISADSWSRGPSLPAPRGAGGLARLGRRLHYVGGFDERGECNVDNHYVYDLDQPAKGWQDITATAAMPEARNHFGTVVLDGRFYAVGGQFDHDGCMKGKNLKFMHVYDPITNKWKRLADLPDVQSHTEPSTFAYNGRLYSLGGQGARSDEVWEYSPEEDKWRVRKDLELPLRLIAPGARVYKDNLYVMVGGEVAVNVPRTQVRVTYFGENNSQELKFYPEKLSPAADAVSAQRILLSNLSAEDEVAYSLNLESLPGWLSVQNAGDGTARESFAEVNVTVDPTKLANGTYSYQLRAAAAGYRTATLDISFKVTDGAPAPDPSPEPDEPEDDTDEPDEEDSPPAPPREPLAGVSVEAECNFDGTATAWSTVNDKRASGGTYLMPRQAGPRDLSRTATVDGSTSLSVDLATAGDYYISVRTLASSGASDSFWYRINGGDWLLWGNGLQTGDAFAWRAYRGNAHTLPAGRVTIDVFPREEGILIDKFFLSMQQGAPTDKEAGDANCPSPDDPTTDPDPEDAAHYVYAEAECAMATGDWQTIRNPLSNNKVTVCIGRSTYDQPVGPTAEDQLSFDVVVPAADTYGLYLRLSALTNSTNSFWVRIDDGQWIKYWTEVDGRVLLTTGFEWREVNASGELLRFALSKGSHRITIANRESGTILDKLLLSTSGLPDAPSATDIACGSQSGQLARGHTAAVAGLQPAAVTEVPMAIGVFPNPSSGLTTLVMELSAGDVLIELRDVNGRMVLQQRLHDHPGGRLRQQLDVTQIPAGMYRLRVVQADRQAVLQLLRQ